VQVVDLASPTKAPAIIAAHETALAHIALNRVRRGGIGGCAAAMITSPAHFYAAWVDRSSSSLYSACPALPPIQDGTMLATASEKGTLVRVFDSQSGKKLCEVRRGSERAMVHWYVRRALLQWAILFFCFFCARVLSAFHMAHSIAFNDDSTLLCVSRYVSYIL
jgi:hypothetical protein